MHTQEKITINRETTRYFVFQLTLENLSSEQNYNQNRNMSGRILVNYYGKIITGDLVDGSGNAIPNAQMTFNSDPITTYTDTNGYFEFKNVPVGSHTIEVINEDETKTLNVEVKETSETNVTNNEINVSGNRAKIEVTMNNSGITISRGELTLAEAIEEKYTLVSDASIDFGAISSASNGEGLYLNDQNSQGGTTKYFRGNVNNYVEFGTYNVVNYHPTTGGYENEQYETLALCQENHSSGNCALYHNAGDPITWRVVRINSSGNVRLITQDTILPKTAFNTSYNNQKYVGYTYDRTADSLGASSTIKTALDSWYTSNLSTYSSYINQTAEYCNDASGSTVEFGAYLRNANAKTPSFNCPVPISNYGGTYQLPTGTITLDEATYAGGLYRNDNTSYYLNNGTDFWTMSPCNSSGIEREFRLYSAGGLGYSDVNITVPGYRAVIELNSDVLVTGQGTSASPWVVQ